MKLVGGSFWNFSQVLIGRDSRSHDFIDLWSCF